MKTLILLLISFSCFAQYPQRTSTLTVTEKIVNERTKNSHGFAVGNWLTIDGSGVFQKGSDPTTQEFIGIVSSVTTNTFTFVKPGGTVNTLSGLTAGQRYFAQADGTLSTTATDMPVGIATSTTTLELLLGNFGTTLPPPTIQATIGIASVTSTTITGSGSAGNGDGRIFLASASPISVTPTNNVPYNSDLNFSDGDEIGTGVFVVGFGDITSVLITGLSAGTPYYIVVYEFVQQGNFITYNLSGEFNSTSTTTLSDATTPETPFEITSKKSKQTSIEVTGIRGDGDNIVVVANDSIPVSIDISDGTNPIAGSYGAGTHLGDRNYVVYEGSASTFSIDGLQRDKKIWFKVYEREDTGFLYNILSPVDSAYSAWAYRETFQEGTGDPPGLTYLTASSNVWYDFSDLTFADEANITNGDAGLVDQGPNTNTAVISGTPVTNEIDFNGTRKAARTASTSAISSGVDGDAFFNTSTGFEIHWSGSVPDGRAGTSGQFYGFWGTSNNNSVCYLRLFQSGDVQLQLRDGVAASNTVWAAGGAVADGPQAFVFQVRVDLVNDLITFYKDGAVVTSGFFSGTALSAQDFTNFNATNVFVIGNINLSGSLIANTNGQTINTAQFAITPLLTDEQRDGIHDVFAFTAAAGADFDDWDITDPAGFTANEEDDSLRLVGSAGGFGNYLEYIEVIPDSLQNFTATIDFRITGALTTNASGLGVGIRNLTASEANQAVFGHMSMDTNATSFGKAELFSGTGATGDGSVSFRSASSGVFIPAEDSVYRIIYERSVIGNDALNSITVYDPTDSSTLTTDWVETNRPSSNYFGTTMRAFIWFQGPDFKIGEFSVVRTSSEDTAPPPTPVTFDFRTDQVNGSDANPCTDAAPCATLPVTVAAIQASGGSDKSWGIGPGTYALGTSLVLPTNLGDMNGAGIDVTVIEGTSTMDQAFGYGANTRALIQAVSSSSTNVTTTFSGFTLRGGSPAARRKNNGLYIRFRNNIIVDGIKIEYFNTAGIYVDRANNVQITNSTIIESGGSNNQDSQTGYPVVGGSLGSFSTGNIMIIGPITGLEIDNSTINAPTYGSGYGGKTGGTSGSNSFDNTLIHNNSVTINPTSAGSTGPNFSFEFHDALLSSGDVFGDLDIYNNVFNGGQISLSTETVAANDGAHKIYNNNFTTTTAVVEAFAHNIEFYNNWVTGGCRGILFQGGTAQASTYSNHNVHHNYAEISNSVGIFKYTRRILNGYYGNNTIITFGNGNTSFIINSGTTAGSTFTGEDNVIWWTGGGSGGWYTFSQNPTASIWRNNFSNNVNTTQALTGVTVTGNQTGLNPSGWFNNTGAKPTPYYGLAPGSALIGAGNGGDSIGASQP